MAKRLGKLEEPPIVEVVCGLMFAPLAGLDPVTLGAFWKPRRNDFPRREFKVPVVSAPDAIELPFGPDLGPIRTWLVSKDDVFIIQVQADRFYLNWRARDAGYPRFNDWTEDGGQPSKGVLSMFLEAVRSFASFCSAELGSRIEIQGIELAKIDHLARGRHWSDAGDLAKLVPMLQAPLEFSGTDAVVGVRASSRREDGNIDVAIDSVLKMGQPAIPAIKLEFRRTVRRAIEESDLESVFQRANQELNDIFVRFIPTEQHYRFAKGWQP